MGAGHGPAGNSRAVLNNRGNKIAIPTLLILTGGMATPRLTGRVMCEKCVEIDKRTERYRRLLLGVGDQVTVDRAKELIADLEAQKIALHPEKKQ